MKKIFSFSLIFFVFLSFISAETYDDYYPESDYGDDYYEDEYYEDDYYQDDYYEDEYYQEEDVESSEDDDIGGRSLVGITFGYSPSVMKSPTINIDVSASLFSFFFAGFDLNFMFPGADNDIYPIIPDATFIMTNIVKLGFNLDLNFINIFFSGGMGINYFRIFTDLISSNDVYDTNTKIPQDQFDFVLNFAFGADIPIFSNFALTGSYTVTYVPKPKTSKNSKKGHYPNIHFGVAFLF